MSSPRVGNPRVGVSASCPVTALSCSLSISLTSSRLVVAAAASVHHETLRVGADLGRRGRSRGSGSDAPNLDTFSCLKAKVVSDFAHILFEISDMLSGVVGRSPAAAAQSAIDVFRVDQKRDHYVRLSTYLKHLNQFT